MANFKIEQRDVRLTDGKYITNLDVCANNLDVTSNIDAGGNVTAQYFIGDGSLLTGVASEVNTDIFATTEYVNNTFASNTYVNSVTYITDADLVTNTYLQTQLSGGGANALSIDVQEFTGSTSTTQTIDTVNYVFHEVYFNGIKLNDASFTATANTLTLIGITPVADDLVQVIQYSGSEIVVSGAAGNAYVTSTFATNTFVNSTFATNTYVNSTFATNTYVNSTFATNTYVNSSDFISNNDLVTNTYLQTFVSSDDTKADNTYVNSTFSTNTYVNTQLSYKVGGDNDTKTTTHTNWNEVYGSGFYDSSANTANGSPTGSWYWGIHHEHSNQNGYGFQFVVQNATTPDVYVRTQTANGWNSWNEIPTTASFTETLLIKDSTGTTLKTMKSIA